MSPSPALTWSDKYAFPNISRSETGAALIDLASQKQWLKVREIIQSYGLYHANWDGLEGEAPSAEVVRNAVAFLTATKTRDLPPPARASLGPDGSIAIEWRSGGVCYQAEISGSSEITWVEFGPESKPVHWSEYLSQDRRARSGDWGGDPIFEGGVADSASAL
jgi:hypothetical protein